MAEFDGRLNNNLLVTKRAIANWQKLKILIVLLRVCGNRFSNNGLNDSDLEGKSKDEENKTCRERFASYVIRPNSIVSIMWDVLIGIAYLFCYWLDPFTLVPSSKVLAQYKFMNIL